MSAPAAGLLDTSVFIAKESGRPIAELPARVAVCVVTIGELQLGVLAADDPDLHVRRADTLALARTADPPPIGEPVMSPGPGLSMTAAAQASTAPCDSPTR